MSQYENELKTDFLKRVIKAIEAGDLVTLRAQYHAGIGARVKRHDRRGRRTICPDQPQRYHHPDPRGLD